MYKNPTSKFKLEIWWCCKCIESESEQIALRAFFVGDSSGRIKPESDKGYPVRTLSVGGKKRKRIQLNCPLSIRFPRGPLKFWEKNSGNGGAGIIQPGPHSWTWEAGLTFLRGNLRINCTSLSSSLYGTFAALWGFIAQILRQQSWDFSSFFLLEIADLYVQLLADLEKIGAGRCENWCESQEAGDTSSDEPQTSIITWKMTQSTWSIGRWENGGQRTLSSRF